MRALIHAAMLIYPADWRRRYGREFTCLIEDSTRGSAGRWRDFFDIVRGALTMRFTGRSVAKLAIAWGCVGLLLGFFVAVRISDHYEASTTLAAPSNDFDGLVKRTLTDEKLAWIISNYDLYKTGVYPLDLMPHAFIVYPPRHPRVLADVIAQMRRDIRIERRPSGSAWISYVGRQGPLVAQVCNQVAAALVEQNFAEAGRHPAPNRRLTILTPARVPERPIGPNRPLILILGFLGGASLGAMISLLRPPPMQIAV